MSWREVFRFGFDERDRNRLAFGIDLDAKDIIHSALGLLPRFSVNDFDGAGGFLAPDKILSPATGMEAGSMSFARVSASPSDILGGLYATGCKGGKRAKEPYLTNSALPVSPVRREFDRH